LLRNKQIHPSNQEPDGCRKPDQSKGTGLNNLADDERKAMCRVEVLRLFK
jgi:hypothetical protein